MVRVSGLLGLGKVYWVLSTLRVMACWFSLGLVSLSVCQKLHLRLSGQMFAQVHGPHGGGVSSTPRRAQVTCYVC